jgi:TRAP-type C4-dicarboxylate transport system substrate-binding protein
MAPGAITTGENLDRLIEMIEENTNGRIDITRHPVDSIVSATELLDATGTGILDSFVCVGGDWQGTIPLATVENGIPQGWRTQDEMLEILWDYGLEDMVRQEYLKHNTYLVTEYSGAPSFLTYHLIKPITSLADIQGKKIRAFGPYLQLAEKLGASPITMSIGEVYSALATGTVDGAFLATSWSGPNKIYEIAPYLMWPVIDMGGTHHFQVNLDKWNALPEDLQTIVYLTGKEWSAWNSRYYNTRYLPNLQALEDWGFQFNEISDADQQTVLAASMEIWDDIAASDSLAANGIQLMKDYFKDIGRPGF